VDVKWKVKFSFLKLQSQIKYRGVEIKIDAFFSALASGSGRFTAHERSPDMHYIEGWFTPTGLGVVAKKIIPSPAGNQTLSVQLIANSRLINIYMYIFMLTYASEQFQMQIHVKTKDTFNITANCKYSVQIGTD
jgi:hypothetical protein